MQNKLLHITSYFLIGIYLFMVLQPAIPIIDYILNKDFISNNLCIEKDVPMSTCNGKCHLVKQLVDISTANNQQLPNQDYKKYFDFGVHLIVDPILLDFSLTKHINTRFNYNHILYNNIISIPTPPPKAFYS